MNQQQKQYNVILIGDSCIDEYHYGTVDRISPEAPIPVFCPKEVVSKDGMAANVAANLLNLGIKVRFYHSQVSVKIRMIDTKTGQHLLRVDKDATCDPLRFDELALSGADAIVISDYNKGTVTYDLIEQIQEYSTVPIFLDTKKTDLGRFSGCTIKINSLEYNNRISEGSNVIVTHGGSSVVWGNRKYSVPCVPVFDVCGAGDTFLAALVAEYLVTGSIDRSIPFAIRAAGITVQHLGVYAPTMEEINGKA
jgi:D-beta-D-heptose 7-phosphate kinase/D-beta-D-heptose 1-phosphate adenosyltransferase